jgi:hypothetical protein
MNIDSVDRVLADSFPASDPPSWVATTVHVEPARGTPANAPRSRPFIEAALTAVMAGALALLVPVAVLLIGLPVALVISGVAQALAFVFNLR